MLHAKLLKPRSLIQTETAYWARWLSGLSRNGSLDILLKTRVTFWPQRTKTTQNVFLRSNISRPSVPDQPDTKYQLLKFGQAQRATLLYFVHVQSKAVSLRVCRAYSVEWCVRFLWFLRISCHLSSSLLCITLLSALCDYVSLRPNSLCNVIAFSLVACYSPPYWCSKRWVWNELRSPSSFSNPRRCAWLRGRTCHCISFSLL